MSQTPAQLPNHSPSRRGTPSTQEPIPFFGSQREATSGGTDFFSSIRGTQQQNSSSGVYQTSGSGVYQQQQQQQSWTPSQPTIPHGQFQQQYTYSQSIPREVPPRCATGPAQEQTYAGYGNASYNANAMAANMDPYRSASVVYGGIQYGSQYGYQAPPANSASASWGPANQSEPLVNNADGILDTAATTYASGAGAGGDGGNGVVYDEISGQYYDTNSGQYYDNATGMWYYPDQQASHVVADETQLVSSGTINQSHSGAALPTSNDDVKDGAAFFDSLISSQEQPHEQETQNDATIPKLASTTDNAERQVPDTHASFSDSSNMQADSEQNHSPGAIATAQPDVDALQANADAVETSVVLETDLLHVSTPGVLNSSSPQALSDPAAVADAAVAAVCETISVDNPINATIANSGNVDPKSNGTTEPAPEWTSAATESTHVLKNESATVTALHASVNNGPTDTSQPSADTGNGNVSAFYSQSYSTVNGPVSAKDPQTSAMHTNTFTATAPLSVEATTVLEGNSLQVYGDDFGSAMYPETDLNHQQEIDQQPSYDGITGQMPIEPTQQLPHEPSGEYWGTHTEQPSLDTGVNGSSIPSGSIEAVNEANHHILQNSTHSDNMPPPTTLPVSDGESYQLSDNTMYKDAGDNASYGYTNSVNLPNDTNHAGYTGSGAIINTFQYSHQGDDEVGDIQRQQQYAQRDVEYSSSSFIHPSSQFGGDHSSTASVPVDPYTHSSAMHHPATFVPPVSSKPQSTYQDIGNSVYETIPHAAVSHSASGYDSQANSNRPSTELPYYDRDTSAASQDNSSHDGIIDPLGRLNACYPVAAFGFGGKFASMFPKHVQRLNIYDSGKASRVAPGMLCVQKLSGLISDVSGVCDPQLFGAAPLLTGETTRPALLRRRDAAVSGGKAWLDTALATNLLSPEEKALFEVLLAILESFDDTDPLKLDLGRTLKPLRSLFCDVGNLPVEDGSSSSQLLPEISNGSLEQIRSLETLLLDGKREEAISTACCQGMWAHALIIASCTGKKQWQSVVTAYTNDALKDRFSSLTTQYQLFSGLGANVFADLQGSSGGNQINEKDQFITAADIGFSAAHSLGQKDMQALPEILDRGKTPVQMNHASHNAATKDWAKTLSLILANRTSGDQGAILKLGDCLKDSGRTLAAHICYALTLQSKDIFLPDIPQSAYPRAILLGVDELDHGRSMRSNTFGLTQTPFSRFYRYTPAFIATELYELAFALKAASASDSQAGASTPASGPQIPAISSANNPNGASGVQGPKSALMFCLPHFQAYKLQHAWWLVECGQAALASRYCDAILGILATLPQGVAVPYIHSSLVQGLRDLRERLSGIGMTSIKAAEMAGDTTALSGANSKSWLARAMPRPSFASLMTAFDSSIDKFITGADGSRISLEPSGTIGKYEVGPDRHSFDHQSHGSSQQQPHSPPRPLGATSWGRRTPSPHLATASAAGSTFEQTRSTDAYIPSYGSPRQSMDGRPSNDEMSIHGMGGAEPPHMYTPSNSTSYADNMVASGANQQFAQHMTQPQWGDPANFGNNINGHGQFIDPAAVFGATDLHSVANPISGMASSMPPVASGQVAQAATLEYKDEGEDEDIFGFSKRSTAQTPVPGSVRQSMDMSRKSLSSSTRNPTDTKDDKANTEKKDGESDDKAGSGVIGMLKNLWGGRKNQANLGEESNFVYDPELKRWVDKNAPDSQKDTGPPPPPPPSMMRFQPQSASVPPPPMSAGMGSRPGSVLPPHPSTDPSRTGTPVSTLGSRTPSIPPPPVSAGGNQGAKRRGARAKYVNVM
ncbi:hypothetical protein EV179_004818 [Coemansia sp. RSA 487]|nr:hypothetical protein EV179_004818 [Coemansia sp. RSA 487]